MAGYQGIYMQRFQNYLQRSGEHKVIQKLIDTVLRPQITKMAEGKTGFGVLGVGSGGGEMDVYLISILQSVLQSVPISVEVVEPSTDLTQNFKDLVSKTSSLRDVSFNWNTVTCADYETQIKKTKQDVKFDLIHMIQMLYYVDDPKATLKFFHSLLKENGKLLIIHEAASSGWEILWKTFKKDLCTNTLSDYISAGDIRVQLDALGLRYEELVVKNTLDITDCFTEGNKDGQMLLDFMTDREDFHASFSAEVRSSMLELLKNECSTTTDGRVLFNCSLSALLVHA
ncbi:histamine N-methyltransferase-like [Astyanax mexicanus]|uniref:Histamine N-methyltransferase n=1 Tax=Astyanax mexicanus TaxID=7994 RepID=A0A8B9RCK6_ASTMX|nr:histamine N-methyltransferase-like [Astyanax mexicanus]